MKNVDFRQNRPPVFSIVKQQELCVCGISVKIGPRLGPGRCSPKPLRGNSVYLLLCWGVWWVFEWGWWQQTVTRRHTIALAHREPPSEPGSRAISVRNRPAPPLCGRLASHEKHTKSNAMVHKAPWYSYKPFLRSLREKDTKRRKIRSFNITSIGLIPVASLLQTPEDPVVGEGFTKNIRTAQNVLNLI